MMSATSSILEDSQNVHLKDCTCGLHVVLTFDTLLVLFFFAQMHIFGYFAFRFSRIDSEILSVVIW